MHNLSYENESYLHENENSFSYERLCTKTCFEKEVHDNSEMTYSVANYLLALSWSFFCFLGQRFMSRCLAHT